MNKYLKELKENRNKLLSTRGGGGRGNWDEEKEEEGKEEEKEEEEESGYLRGSETVPVLSPLFWQEWHLYCHGD